MDNYGDISFISIMSMTCIPQLAVLIELHRQVSDDCRCYYTFFSSLFCCGIEILNVLQILFGCKI